MDVASLIRAIASLSWLLFFGAIALAVVRASRRQPAKTAITGILVTLVLALVLSAVGMGIVFIQPDERGVVISALSPQGYRQQPLEPGLRLIMPFAEYVVRYPISKQNYTMSIAPSEGAIQGDNSITARTLDGQEIFIDASVIYAINPPDVVKVHIAWQNRYANDLVRARHAV